MSRSFDHMRPRGESRSYYPPHTRWCSRRCDWCNPRLLWVRSRERLAVEREIATDVQVMHEVEVEAQEDRRIALEAMYA